MLKNFIKTKLKQLSFKTRDRKLEMKQYTHIKKDGIINKEMADIQNYIYQEINNKE